MVADQLRQRLTLLWPLFTRKSFQTNPSRVHNQGWTLMEMAVVAVIAGILSALAIPSMVGIQGRNQLNDATNQVKAAIQEAQRSAIKRGLGCNITLASTGVTGPGSCLSSPVTFNQGITLTQNVTNLITFSFRGNTTNARTIVLESSNTVERRCIVITSGIGILRVGTYKSKIELPTLGTPTADDCATSL